MREVHCNLQIIRMYEAPDNLKVGFRLPYDTTKDLAEIFWVSQSLHSWGMESHIIKNKPPKSRAGLGLSQPRGIICTANVQTLFQ